MSRLPGTDGIPYDGSADLDAAIESGRLEVCDLCSRAYDPELFEDIQGNVMCAHCCFADVGFNALPESEVDEVEHGWGKAFLEYIADCAPGHRPASCWMRANDDYPRGCHLCTARSWLTSRDFRLFSNEPPPSPPPLPVEPEALAAAARDALADAFDVRVDDGQVLARHIPSSTMFVLIAPSGRTPFFLGSKLLIRRQAAELLGEGVPDAADKPFSGFDVQQLAAIMSRNPWLRLPSVHEWRLAQAAVAGLEEMVGETAQLVGVERNALVTVGGPDVSWRHNSTTRAPDRWPFSDTETRDAVGRLVPATVPDHVALRLAFDMPSR